MLHALKDFGAKITDVFFSLNWIRNIITTVAHHHDSKKGAYMNLNSANPIFELNP